MNVHSDVEAVSRACRGAGERLDGAIAVASFHLSELARLAVGERGEEFSALYSKVKSSLIAPVTRENENYAALTALSSCLLARLCRDVCLACAETGNPISERDFFPLATEAENSRIAYMRSPLADEAYRVFSKTVREASVVYPQSFAAACEDVYNGRVGYCILPYESSDEGSLSGFVKLIAKYELSPVRVCSLATEHGSTRFVLLGRSQYLSALGGGKRLLKITVDRPEADTVLRICSAAEELCVPLRKTESTPVSLGEGYAAAMTFEFTGKDASPFLLYLALEVPECSEKAIFEEL